MGVVSLLEFARLLCFMLESKQEAAVAEENERQARRVQEAGDLAEAESRGFERGFERGVEVATVEFSQVTVEELTRVMRDVDWKD